ncbi:sensor histidine kinase [Pseudolysinimonas sp.]|uniref:sensor histidine kinase n=1 Tax=Pseudolysinimonas sp. TaxID=2680009 RepID=UPI003F80744C
MSLLDRVRAPWSLRRRLVAAILALLLVVSVIVGAVSVLALQQSLTARLDDQLRQSLGFVERNGIGRDLGAGGGPSRRVGAVTYLSNTTTGAVQGFYVGVSGEPSALTAAQGRLLAAVAPPAAGAPGPPQPVTVDLGGSLGRFRVVADDIRFAQTGDPGVLVVGQSLSEVDATTRSLVLIFALITLGALVAAGIATTVIVRFALRPLDRVAATAARVAELPLDKGDVALAERVPEEDTDPRTEVGKVGDALNRMLGHVEDALVARERSENKVRAFVADASHELRTPLASIRGYSELTRRSGLELHPDIQRSLGRIESESIRMGELVEDLLLLARLDEGKELVLGDVDLLPILVDAVGDAAVAGPDHAWSLEETPDEPVVVLGDGGRLHQVFANILANARTHTPEGTTVEVSLAVEGEEAVVTIHDDGPGIPEGLQPVLFERFVRGDGSRSRAAGSTGLGLAIVAAVVDGHGGTVEAVSTPGDTRFTVRLPLRPR